MTPTMTRFSSLRNRKQANMKHNVLYMSIIRVVAVSEIYRPGILFEIKRKMRYRTMKKGET